MSIGINNLEILRYFKEPETAFGKSVQPDWRFYGLFVFNPLQGISVGRGLEMPPVIQSFHLISVTIPTYAFQKEVMMYGQVPRSFPVLDFNGFDLSMTLEEDQSGTVEYFINWNQRNIIDSDGYYNAPDLMKLHAFVVEVQDKMGLPVCYYTFHDIYFLAADPVTYSYESNSPVRRNLTFGCDRLSTTFTKQNALVQGASIAQGVSSLFKR